MTYAEEQHWKRLGVEAINAEMERRLGVWLEQRCGDRFQVRQVYADKYETTLRTQVIFRGRRAACLEYARQMGRWCAVEHQDAPAVLAAVYPRPVVSDRQREYLPGHVKPTTVWPTFAAAARARDAAQTDVALTVYG